MFRRVAQIITWCMLLACLGRLLVANSPVLAAPSTPGVATPAPADQPVIGNALSYVPNGGVIDWRPSIGAQTPGRAIADLNGSPAFPALTTPIASSVAATPATVTRPGQSAAQPPSQAVAQPTAQAAQPTAPPIQSAAQSAAQPASRPVAAQTPLATPATRQGLTGVQQTTSATAPHRTTAAARALPTTQPLHLPAYTPIQVPAPTALDGSGLLQLAGKFAVVLVLLFLCLRILRAVVPRLQGPVAGRGGALVLYSESIGDKQRICLLDLQVKLALVSISNTSVTPITTIDDADQIASLRARYQSGQPTRRQQPAPGRRQATRRHEARHQEATAPFSAVLQQEAGATAPLPWATAAAAEPTRRLPALQRGVQPDVPQGTHASDAVVGQALAAIRSLRQKVDQS